MYHRLLAPSVSGPRDTMDAAIAAQVGIIERRRSVLNSAGPLVAQFLQLARLLNARQHTRKDARRVLQQVCNVPTLLCTTHVSCSWSASLYGCIPFLVCYH